MHQTRYRLSALLASVALAGAACSTPGSAPGRGRLRRRAHQRDVTATHRRTDQPLSWGPTEGELAEATEMVAGWSAEQLAGQVIVGRYHGTDPAEAGRLVRDLHLAGVSVTGENVVDEAQVRATTGAVAKAFAADGRDFPPLIGVDQEGGVVSHLSGVATEFPSFATAGAAIAGQGRAGRVAVRRAAYTTGLELRDLGFTWVFAPVADVTIGDADPTIGSRSPSTDPAIASAAIEAAVTGYDEGGHRVDHQALPRPRRRDGRQPRDAAAARLVDGRAARAATWCRSRPASRRGAPAVMIGHLDVRALAPGVPSSLAPETYDLLRDELGFEGVAVTDSLGMGAVAGLDKPAVTALNAGADLLLMPADTRATARRGDQRHRLRRGQPRARRGGRRPRGRAADVAAADQRAGPGAGGRRGPRRRRVRCVVRRGVRLRLRQPGRGRRGGAASAAPRARAGAPARRRCRA